MAEFQRKQNPFLHRGMWWNAPAEKIPDGMLPWAKNIRVLEQGTVSAAYGETLVYGPVVSDVFGEQPGHPPAPGGGFYAIYLHSMQRLNILSEATASPGIFALDQNLRRNYVLGADNWLFVFQNQQTLSNAAINPVPTPGTPVVAAGSTAQPDQNTVDTTIPFSGNPLSIVDSLPVAGIYAWKYIGDSNQMVTVGYYPGDEAGVTPGRALTMGLTPPVNNTVPIAVAGGDGNLVGSYQWAFAYRRLETGARSNPSAATRASVAAPATTAGAGVQWHAQFVVPPTPIDPITGKPDEHVVVDIYRFGGNVLRWALVGSAPGGVSFTDNKSDLSILAAPSPPSATDQTTGLSRFNLFRPFVIQDIRRGGQGSISQARTGGPFYVTASAPQFKLDWLPGSTINVDGTTYTIYQVLSPTLIELADDLSGTPVAPPTVTPPVGPPNPTQPGTGNPIPPGATVVGPIPSLDIFNISTDTSVPFSPTVTFSLSWTPPAENIDLWNGTAIWIVGGTTPSQIDSVPKGQLQLINKTIPVPAGIGAEPLEIGAISIDVNIGLTYNAVAGAGQAPARAILPGIGGMAPGEVADLTVSGQIQTPDGNFQATFSWLDNTIYQPAFGGVQLWLVATTGTEPQQMLGSVQGDNRNQLGLTVPAPAAAQGETWTVAAITINNVGARSDNPAQYGQLAFQSPTRDWIISATGTRTAESPDQKPVKYTSDVYLTGAEPRAPHPPPKPPIPPRPPTPGATVHSWDTPAGTLLAGQPLAHLWGVYGLGQGGSYIFGCGDTNASSTLYWTNGNDPDSTDVVNSLIVTSPSEKLQTGCIYQGNPFVWTTERMFQIYPSYTVFGQFTVQELAGARGVWLEWSLSVQNNGFADVSITWRGKDGIYDYSGGLNRLTDPLFAFFPHDGAPGLAPETIMPFIGANSEHPESVGNIDDTQPQYHRLTWFHGELFYDFVALTPGPGGVGSHNTFSTLVWDSVNIPGGGWVSLDQKFADTSHPIGRSVEVGAEDLKAQDDKLPDGSPGGPMTRGGNMKVTWGPIIYDYAGYQRDLFQCRVITKAEDLGDSRSPKLWGDFWLDCTPLNSFDVTPLVDFNAIALATLPCPPLGLTQLTGTRQEFVMDFAEWRDAGGKGQLGPSLGLDIRWQPVNGQFVASLYQVTYTFIVKPDFVEFRATDRSDVGAVQAKYLMAANIEANTLGRDVNVDVWVDGNRITTLTLNHDFQSEKPYAWEPVAGYEFQVQLRFDQPDKLWELFQVNWLFDPWPDAVARKYSFTNLGDSSDKFIQGIILPMETGGEMATVGVWGDDDNQWHYWQKSTPPLKKMGIDLDISQPFTAHILQFQTLTPHRIWWQEARVVWEPIPEATNTWQTQQTDNDLGGWSHLRDCYIAYMGGTGSNLATPLAGPIQPVLTITTEYGSMKYDLDPVMPNQYVRCYRVLSPQKAKWHQYRVDAPLGGVRLYQKDSVIRIKEWGSAGAYINSQPFGDNSRQSGARM